ncbi:MAG: primosomal protein N', partial [Pseudomonadota bacterium]
MYYLDIAPSRPLTGTLTYSCDELLPVGARVEIPLGTVKCFGFVVGEAKSKPEGFEVKSILKKSGTLSYFNKKNLEFYRWLCDYYHYPLGEALSLITPTFTPKKIKLLGEAVTTSVKEHNPLVNLTEEQKNALNTLRSETHQRKFSYRNLLHGVTGCGKTEVYIEAAKDVINKGRGVIIVVPEIALTPQLIQRITKHFDGEISVIHSEVSKAEKYKTWFKLATGKSLLCIGARSAIFSPMPDIGLVVVDEEQDSSYKQDDRLRYNARDLSLMLGRLFDAKVILTSATPSVESYFNSQENKYSYVTINKRVRELCMPTTTVVDLTKAQMVGRNFSAELVDAVRKALSQKQQIILYINRRGYSNTIMCRSCGQKLKCPHCSITLTEHKNRKVMLCHYCGHERNIPDYCNACGSHNLYSIGAGTEKIYEEIGALFPEAKIARMDSDSINSKKKLGDILDKIINKK